MKACTQSPMRLRHSRIRLSRQTAATTGELDLETIALPNADYERHATTRGNRYLNDDARETLPSKLRGS